VLKPQGMVEMLGRGRERELEEGDGCDAAASWLLLVALTLSTRAWGGGRALSVCLVSFLFFAAMKHGLLINCRSSLVSWWLAFHDFFSPDEEANPCNALSGLFSGLWIAVLSLSSRESKDITAWYQAT
jgi:hypothetical protein